MQHFIMVLESRETACGGILQVEESVVEAHPDFTITNTSQVGLSLLNIYQ